MKSCIKLTILLIAASILSGCCEQCKIDGSDKYTASDCNGQGVSIRKITLHKKSFGRFILEYEIVNNTGDCIWLCDKVDYYDHGDYELFPDRNDIVFSKKAIRVPEGLLLECPIYSSHIKLEPQKSTSVKCIMRKRFTPVKYFSKDPCVDKKRSLSDFENIIIKHGYYKCDLPQLYHEGRNIDWIDGGGILIDCFWEGAQDELEIIQSFPISLQ